MLAANHPAVAQPAPFLAWITNSSVKLEQVIGDADWATGSNTVSQTITRFNIYATDLGSSFLNGTNLIFLFGDTRGSNVDYHAADPLAWSAAASGEQGLLLNFYTNSAGSNVFINPPGISMAGDDTPNAGISISNVIYLVCNTGSVTTNDDKHADDYSVLVTFDQTNLNASGSPFQTNRTISVTTNGGHFVYTSLHQAGTNILIFGEGKYRKSDIYLSSVPISSFVSGVGTLYFAGLTNGQPAWTTVETNAVPIVQDNPTNGPAWPNDSPTVAHLSVAYATGLGLWLMAYDGGRNAIETDGVYFSSAAQPWGPWTKPQLIFNAFRDLGYGVFMFNPTNIPTGPAGPTADPAKNSPTTTPGVVYAPNLIEPFITVSNSTLYIYYLMSTWNPYTVVKMRSAFDIVPVIDPSSLVKLRKKFSFAWTAPTNITCQVDYSTNLLSGWMTFTNLITSTNGTFNFTDTGTNSGGFGNTKFYRLRSLP
jgi:hypothetical protein